MKMIIAIVKDSETEQISQSLLSANFRVTKLATTGGFLREGATTLMIGVEDDKVDDALSLIRNQIDQDPENPQATIYVLNIKNFSRV
jgi:uncharacterized protein YaaQ